MTEINNVSDTAFLVASFRAVETMRPDALFHDPLAGRLAGQFGRRIAANLPRAFRMSAWSIAIRTRIIDDFILSAVEEGVDTILNLGAGLDTRPYRMSLPETLTWIEVDYPNIIELKERELEGEKPVCRLERIKVDLADLPAREAILSEVNSQGANVLVLMEGVIPYLDVTEVAKLIEELRGLKHFRYLIADYYSPEFLQYRERTAVKQRMENVPWKFKPEDYWAFFKGHGWSPRQTRYLAEESERLNRRIPYPLLLRLILKLTRFLAPPEKRGRFRTSLGYVWFEAVSA